MKKTKTQRSKEIRFWLDDGTPVVIIKELDDPLALRVSLGGRNDKEIGFYLVYRGEEDQIQKLLEKAVEAFKQSQEKI